MVEVAGDDADAVLLHQFVDDLLHRSRSQQQAGELAHGELAWSATGSPVGGTLLGVGMVTTAAEVERVDDLVVAAGAVPAVVAGGAIDVVVSLSNGEPYWSVPLLFLPPPHAASSRASVRTTAAERRGTPSTVT